VEQIIDAGAEVAAVDDLGRNVFHHFAEGNGDRFSKEELKKIVDLWTKHCGADAQNAEWGTSNWTWTNARQLNRTQYIHTPLSMALEARNWNVFEVLRESGAIMRTTFDLRPFLEDAVRDYQPSAVWFLIDHGATPGPDSYFLPELYRNSLDTSPSILEKFGSILNAVVGAGADVNTARWDGNTTLLNTAKQVNSGEAVQMLLNIGADIYHLNREELDAFLLAAIHGNLDTLHCLLVHATKNPSEGHWTQSLDSLASQQSSENLTRVCLALKHCDLVNKPKGGRTLLWRTAESGNNDMVKQLLAHGADVEISDEDGWRPIHVAAFEGHKEVVQSLLQAGADVCAATSKWSNDNVKPSGLYRGSDWTGHALHLASMRGHATVVEILLANHADVNARTWVEIDDDPVTYISPGHGPTALHIALDTGTFYHRGGFALDDDRLNIANMLVEYGADVASAADHLEIDNILRFEKHQPLWDKLRLGISAKGRVVPPRAGW
jgi:ankyrin repeat protein